MRADVLAWTLAAVLGPWYVFAAAPPGAAELVEGRGFRLHFTPRAAGLAAPLLEALERRREDIAKRMGRDFDGAVDVYLADGPAEAQAIAPVGMVPPPLAS